MLNNVPLSERSARPPRGLLFHPSLLFHRVPSLNPSTERLPFSRFSSFFSRSSAPLLTAKHPPLRVSCVSGLPRLPRPARSPGGPRGRASPRVGGMSTWLPGRSPKLPAANGKTCPVGLEDLPGATPQRRGKIYCLQEQRAPSTPRESRSGASGGPAHASPRPEKRRSLQAPEPAPSYTHIYIPKWNFFFSFPFPFLPPPDALFHQCFCLQVAGE